MADMDYLKSIFEKFQSQYSFIRILYGGVKNTGKIDVLRSKMIFLGDAVPPPQPLMYGSFVLGSLDMPANIFHPTLDNIITKGEVDTLRIGQGKMIVKRLEYSQLPSPSYKSSGNGWSAFAFCVRPESPFSIPDQPLVSTDKKVPVFRSTNDALSRWTDIQDYSGGDSQYGITIVMPDYRGRIKKVMVTDKKVLFNIEGGGILRISDNDVASDGSILIDSLKPPYYTINAFLVSNSGDVIDHEEFSLYATSFPPNVEFEPTSSSLNTLIAMGEGQCLEWKSSLNERDDFLETVLAFSNTNDGRILVGIDDRGKVVGVSSIASDTKRVSGYITGGCDPRIDFTTNTIKYEDKDIIEVIVKRGTNRPYLHNATKKIYVRYKDNDIAASRAEIDEMYRK